MFIKTRNQIINSSRITRIYVDTSERGLNNVVIEIADGYTFNEYTGASYPAFKTIHVYGEERGTGGLCNELIKTLFTVIERPENFDADEWISERKAKE